MALEWFGLETWIREDTLVEEKKSGREREEYNRQSTEHPSIYSMHFS